MRRAYLLGLFLVPCPAAALGEEPGDAERYEISCTGNLIIDNERPGSESFLWIVDEGAPANEQIFHNGKSVCESTLSCSVEIKPYHIHVSRVAERTESGSHFNVQDDVTINRVLGIGHLNGSITQTQGKVVKRHSVKGTYSCDRHPFSRVI